MLYVSHLKKPQADSTIRSHHADKILSGLRQLERMVNDMLVFARGGEFTPETIPVEALMDDLRLNLEPQLQQCGGELIVVNNAPHSVVAGSRDMLLGSLLNISTNAMQACGQDVVLRVQIDLCVPDGITISISDNGPGIEQELQERIFDPFFTTRSGGTGLGLAVVRAVIQGHQGEINVASSPGQGATFSLRLPSLQDHSALASGLRFTSRSHSRKAKNKASDVIECQ